MGRRDELLKDLHKRETSTAVFTEAVQRTLLHRHCLTQHIKTIYYNKNNNNSSSSCCCGRQKGGLEEVGTTEDLTRRLIDQPSDGAARNIESQTTRVGWILLMKCERKEVKVGGRKVCRELGNSYRVSCCSSNGLRLKSSRRERSHDDISSVIARMIGLFVSAGPAPKSSAPRRRLHGRLGICRSI